ncbi:helix-turn-helix domain-containing protein [Nonomuraea sp. NPDC005983]|uniref:ArsR/SmtB family transcription factor n=1 Tax=Nonomuraea sp. NPDC005983 TaxID=3155595 RepID=UPI0033B8ACEE
MAAEKNRRITDLDELKALGHPLRLRLYRALNVAREATASMLAEQVDEAVSLVSYHLRKLAAHGLIEEADRPGGDARERWWQLAHRGVSTRDRDFRDSPEGVAAHTALSRVAARQREEMYESYLDSQAGWEQEWRDVAFGSESLIWLTASELGQLKGEMEALVAKWQAHGRAAREADTEGRENVALHVYGFPFRTGPVVEETA